MITRLPEGYRLHTLVTCPVWCGTCIAYRTGYVYTEAELAWFRRPIASVRT